MKLQLQVAQNRCVRFICNLGPRESVNRDVLSNLKLLNVENRAKQLCLNHMYNVFHETCPSYISSKFTRVCDRHSYSTRNCSLNFTLPCCKGQIVKTFYFNGAKAWNSMPADIRSASNTWNFRSGVRQFLQDNA